MDQHLAPRVGRSSRRQSGSPTITDVARMAGCSPMTVSRVINGGQGVKPENQEVVRAAIAALNYSPNPAARSLAGAEQVRIGMLYSNPSSGYLSEFLVGGLEQASRNDAQLVIEKCEVGPEEETAARHMIASGVDGVILPPPLCDSARIIAMLAEARLPTVAVASGRPAAGVSAISIDDHAAAFAMTQHIIALGHRRIGFIAGNPNQTASVRREDGFRDAIIAAGIAIDETLIVPGLFTYRSGLDAADALLGRADRPTAIFSANDEMAAAAIAVAHRYNLEVPADLTICGYDDTPLASTIWPALTTIHQPIADMARAAVARLVKEVRQSRGDERTGTEHMLLDFTLVRRQSDAAPESTGHR